MQSPTDCGRRNLTDEQKPYLIGKEYEAMKKTNGASDGFRGNQHAKVVGNQNEYLPAKTKDIVGKEHGTSGASVQRAEQFSQGLDAAEAISTH